MLGPRAASPQVVDLWKRIGLGLDRSCTVGWEDAAQGLDHALSHYSASEAAQHFVRTRLRAIVQIMLEQQPGRLGRKELDCVEKTVIFATSIVVQDIRLAGEAKAVSAIHEVLGAIFDRRKTFYKGRRGGFSSGASPGRPQLRLSAIQRFQELDGLTLLNRYLQQHACLTPSEVNSLHPVMEALGDLPTSTEKEELAMTVLRGLQKSFVVEGEKPSHDSLGSIIEDLQSVLLRGADFVFVDQWRALALGCISSDGAPIVIFGWKQLTKLISTAQELYKGQRLQVWEHDFAKWVIQNRLIERIFDKKCAQPIQVRESTKLLQFMASKSRSDMLLQQANDAWLASNLVLLWGSCTASAGSDLASRIIALFVAVLPLCPAVPIYSLRAAVQETFDERQERPDAFGAVAEFCASMAVWVCSGTEGAGNAKADMLVLVVSVATCPKLSSFPDAYAALQDLRSNEGVEDGDDGNADDHFDDDSVSSGHSSERQSLVQYAGLAAVDCAGYMFVILQQLFMAPSFRELVLSLSDRDPQTNSLVRELKNLFLHLNAAVQLPSKSEALHLDNSAMRQGLPVIRSFLETYAPASFVDSCAEHLKLQNDARMQNDASEFCDKMLEKLSDSVSPATKEAMEGSVGLSLVRQKICRWCNTTNLRKENISLIDCQTRNVRDLAGSLILLTRDEVMEGSNKVYCEACGTGTDTSLKSGLADLPELLIFNLRRFDLDYNTFQCFKTDSRFGFERTIDMGPFCLGDDAQHQQNGSQKYRLVGIVVHSGTASGGAYSALIRERERPRRWMEFANEDVLEFDPGRIETECFGGRVDQEAAQNGCPSTNATMLFYERRR